MGVDLSSKAKSSKERRAQNKLQLWMHPDHVPFYAQRNQSRVTNAHVEGMLMAAIGPNPLPDYVLPKRSATFEEITHDRVQTVIRNQTTIAQLRAQAVRPRPPVPQPPELPFAAPPLLQPGMEIHIGGEQFTVVERTEAGATIEPKGIITRAKEAIAKAWNDIFSPFTGRNPKS